MRTKMISFLLVLIIVTNGFTVSAQDRQDEKVEQSAQILNDFKEMKESIPQQLLEQAEGMVIIPKLINAGLGIGGKRGKGVAIVKNSNGSWSNPVFVTLTGGSVGLQAGVQSVDLVLIFKNRSTLMNIGKGTFNLGGDVSVAAGPVGRSSTADTDYKLEAEVYSYSRSKGLFAGISLNGSVLSIDEIANKHFYKKEVTANSVFSSSKEEAKASVKALHASLNSY